MQILVALYVSAKLSNRLTFEKFLVIVLVTSIAGPFVHMEFSAELTYQLKDSTVCRARQ